MRMRFNFYSKKIPIIYRNIFISFIKEVLSKENEKLKEIYYPSNELKESKKTKPFTFCLSFPKNFTIKKERFKINSKTEIEDMVFYFEERSPISFYLSTCDYNFLVNFYNGLLKTKEFEFSGDIKIKIGNIYLLNEKKVLKEEAKFKTNSPILIEDKNENPVLPEDSNLKIFNNNLNEIQDKIFKDLRGERLKKRLEFLPVKIKKQVIKHTISGFREKTGKPYMTLTCFEGSFVLKGDVEDLKLIYQIGIGLRRGQGFGMVELI